MALTYHHVDVFSPQPFSGNSLAVFPDARGLTGHQMAAITRELRHFESIFLYPPDAAGAIQARVFDLAGEMDFAGHPVIGAACVLHHLGSADDAAAWTLRLPARTVTVATRRLGGRFEAELDQGAADFVRPVGPEFAAAIADQLGLTPADLDPILAPEVVSTGLRYLIVPVAGADVLARARIARDDFEPLLQSLGAQYAYLLDAAGLEGRHWDHVSRVEDVATGSAAGCVAAWLRRHGRIGEGETVTLRQGRFTGRPSELRITAFGAGEAVTSVRVAGAVSLVGEGRLDALPDPASPARP